MKTIIVLIIGILCTNNAISQSALTYFSRGNSKYKLNDYRGAILDYNKAIELNPTLAEAYINRGNTKNDLNDYRGAILDFNKAIELNPTLAKVFNNRGTAKSFLGDKNGSCLDWSKAGELGYGNAYDSIKKYCN